MSQHPSLRSSDKDKQHRSVLKRHERLKILKEKDKWQDGNTVFGLPKVKVIRFKIKKEKAAAAAEGAEGAAATPGTAAAPGAASAAQPKAGGASQAKSATAKPKEGDGKK